MPAEPKKRLSDHELWATDCRGKRKFKTETGAQIAATKIKNASGDRMHPYFCRACRNFHIGH
jgi:hypothetical protein